MMAAEKKYTSQSQQLLLALIEILIGRPQAGFAVADFVAATGKARDQVFWALQNLAAADWARETNGQWSLSPRIRLHQAIDSDLDLMVDALVERRLA